MLRITIELVPCGDESRARVIASGIIANTGTGTATRGDYRVELRDALGRRWKSCAIQDFPRKRLLAWDLLYRILEKLVGNRNRALIPPAPAHLLCEARVGQDNQSKGNTDERSNTDRDSPTP